MRFPILLAAATLLASASALPAPPAPAAAAPPAVAAAPAAAPPAAAPPAAVKPPMAPAAASPSAAVVSMPAASSSAAAAPSAVAKPSKIGVISSPAANATFIKGSSIDFVYKKATAPGVTTRYINVNLNTADSTFELAHNLNSTTDSITGTFPIPDLVFFYLGPSGQGEGVIQVTEFQGGAPISPPATPILLAYS
ncbi:hypothetical protein RQP46_008700 [Phenoliferia psychrophenolica]